MIDEYIINKKTFYNIDSFKFTENKSLVLNQDTGVFEIYQIVFQINESPINIVNTSGALLLHESMFEQCFPDDTNVIEIQCSIKEFDVSLAKCCFYNCNKKYPVGPQDNPTFF